MLPPYSPELDPAERWFQEFRRKLSNRIFESVALMQEALTQTLAPYWKDPALLKRLTGYPWWVEAVESPDGRVLAVQWHPEELIDDHPHSRRVSKWLVEKAAKTAGRRPPRSESVRPRTRA